MQISLEQLYIDTSKGDNELQTVLTRAEAKEVFESLVDEGALTYTIKTFKLMKIVTIKVKEA